MKDRFPAAKANTAIAKLRGVPLFSSRGYDDRNFISHFEYTFVPDKSYDSLFLSLFLIENVKGFLRKKSPSVKGKRPENAAVTLVHARERAYCEENGLVSPWDRN